MRSLLIGVLGATALVAGVLLAPVASAESTDDDSPDVYGYLTPAEEQEIAEMGPATCASLDVSHGGAPPNADSVIPVLEGFFEMWDLESASDVVWESVEADCPEYLDATKQAIASYGNQS